MPTNVSRHTRAGTQHFAAAICSRPGWQRPLLRRLGRLLARRFARGYQRRTATAVDPGELRWHEAVTGLRALVEVAGWVHDGTADARPGHPWLALGPAFARRVGVLTGMSVRAR
jgi:hypothetical protein